jgi:hypothetical protein
MKKIFMLVTILMSVFMLSACEHYFPYYGGGDGYYDGYGGGHGGGGYGEHENDGHEGDD